MRDISPIDCSQTELHGLEQVNYFPRQLLTVDDMVTQREYVLQKLRRHNRFLHGWGVVCGLLVKAAPSGSKPWLVQIGSGYAVGPYGDEIYLAEPAYFDLAKCVEEAEVDSCDPTRLRPGVRGRRAPVYVAIRYAECLSRPVQPLTSGCGCEDDACEYSRIRDSHTVACLRQLPASHNGPEQPLLCRIVHGGITPGCPPCPVDPWVVLARVRLPETPLTAVDNADIDNRTDRRLLFSVAAIQAQLIDCCCNERVRPAVNCDVRPASITRGGEATLTWTTQNADTVTISGIGTVETNGSRTVQPTQTTTYTVTASGQGGAATCQATVQVVEGERPRFTRCAVDPERITAGVTARIAWATENADTVEISGVGTVPVDGSVEVRPDQTTTYTLTARNANGTATCQVTVAVTEAAPLVVTVQRPAPVPSITADQNVVAEVVALATGGQIGTMSVADVRIEIDRTTGDEAEEPARILNADTDMPRLSVKYTVFGPAEDNYTGVRSGANSVTFSNVQLMPPLSPDNPTVLTFTNVRAEPRLVVQTQTVYRMTVSLSGETAIQVVDESQVVATSIRRVS